ncbi:MAG TPA: DUF1684 domain-containing protein, partial [Candidatus Hydrogenedentes bacterium]|nr:DUF1684 domain-containing protein [Candidatus Hydrogenedentota bacterium]
MCWVTPRSKYFTEALSPDFIVKQFAITPRCTRRVKKLSRTLEAPIIRGFRVCEQEISANPWCLYSKFTTCALPTPKNRLPFRIPAGEMVPQKYF